MNEEILKLMNVERTEMTCVYKLDNKVVVKFILQPKNIGLNENIGGLRIEKIEEMQGYENSSYKYKLINYIITNFNEICNEFSYNKRHQIIRLTKDICEMDDIESYKNETRMKVSIVGDELFVIPSVINANNEFINKIKCKKK